MLNLPNFMQLLSILIMRYIWSQCLILQIFSAYKLEICKVDSGHQPGKPYILLDEKNAESPKFVLDGRKLCRLTLYETTKS